MLGFCGVAYLLCLGFEGSGVFVLLVFVFLLFRFGFCFFWGVGYCLLVVGLSMPSSAKGTLQTHIARRISDRQLVFQGGLPL